ncbi:hypothetical protein [Orientia tsutsugamushi]|uniref:hypothetical protein n=1 Tax=Orientia tsutsugamushi TaxID=784 RepID=UPI000D5A29C4|nr:Uncharacterised protein [Orientia tsutsugamushi]
MKNSINLQLAIEQGNYSDIKKALDNGASISNLNNIKLFDKLINIACVNEDYNLAKELIEVMSQFVDHNIDLLKFAINTGNYSSIIATFEAMRKNVLEKLSSNERNSCLKIVTENHNYDAINQALEYGADIKTLDNNLKDIALEAVSKISDYNLIKEGLQYGAEMRNLTNRSKYNIMISAIENNDNDLIKKAANLFENFDELNKDECSNIRLQRNIMNGLKFSYHNTDDIIEGINKYYTFYGAKHLIDHCSADLHGLTVGGRRIVVHEITECNMLETILHISKSIDNNRIDQMKISAPIFNSIVQCYSHQIAVRYTADKSNLQIAYLYGQVKRAILNSAIDIDGFNDVKSYLLRIASEKNDFNVVKEMLTLGVNPGNMLSSSGVLSKEMTDVWNTYKWLESKNYLSNNALTPNSIKYCFKVYEWILAEKYIDKSIPDIITCFIECDLSASILAAIVTEPTYYNTKLYDCFMELIKGGISDNNVDVSDCSLAVSSIAKATDNMSEINIPLGENYSTFADKEYC